MHVSNALGVVSRGFRHLIIFGLLGLCSVSYAELPVEEKKQFPQCRVLFLGDSLTAGYGVGVSLAFPEQVRVLALAQGIELEVINAGVSGDTSAGGLRRIERYLDTPYAVLVLALGANDALRGLDPVLMRQNLAGIVEKVRQRTPTIKILLAGMEAPPNFGQEFQALYRSQFFQLSKEKGLDLIPFLLQDVAARADLNISDGIHPNEKGQRIIAQLVWEHLQTLLSCPTRAGRA